MSTRPFLRRAVAGDLDAFAREAWGRHAVLSRRDDLAKDRDGDAEPGFGDLFSLDAVDELLAHRGLRTPFLRIAKQGTVVDSAHFTGGGGVGAEVADQLRDDRVAALFADGHTVVLQGVHRTWAPVTELATGLNADLGHPVQVNAYVTPASSTGFSAHYDVHDVFVLQIAGTKRWHVHAPVHPDPLRTQPWNDRSADVAARAQEEPLLDEVLHPGDALYLPRGYLHSATAQGEVSAHLTVGVHVVTRHAVLETLLAGLADDPELRASLPLGVDVSDPAALAPHLEAVARRAAQHLADRSADDEHAARAARRLRGRVWTGNRPESLRPLRQAAAVHEVGPQSVVRLRHGLRHRTVTGDDGGLRLELGDRTLDLPAAAATPLATLLSGHDVTLADVGEDEPGDAVVVARRLLTEGVLVTPDSVAGPMSGAPRRPCRYDGQVTAAETPTPEPLEGNVPFRCSQAARERDDPLFASAPPARRWLLVEHPGPWGARALGGAGFGDDVVTAVDAFCRAHDARFQLIRRTAARGAPTEAGGRFAVVDCRPGHESVRWGRVDAAEALPAALADLDATTEPSDEPVYLVCAHGRHDACCAVRGRPVAAVLAAGYADRTWETTHTGGDRFAPNVVLLPHGLVLGRVPATDALTVAERYDAGEVVPSLLRGRAGIAPPVQGAQHHARVLLDEHRVDALAPIDARQDPDDPATWTVRLAAPDGAGEVEVVVRERWIPSPTPLTCSAGRAASMRTYDLVTCDGDGIGTVATGVGSTRP